MNTPAIPVTFTSIFNPRLLVRVTLPAVPQKDTEIYLGTLAYVVVNVVWFVFPTADVEIHIRLRPQMDAEGEWPFDYPEEAKLWKQWSQTTPDEEE